MPKASSLQAVGTILLLTTTLTLAKVTARRTPGSLAEPLQSVPLEITGFTGTDNPPLPPGVLHELRATTYVSRSYRKERVTADLFIAYYAQQRAGESMHSPKHCLPGAGWEIWNYGTVAMPVQGRRIVVNKYSIRRDNDRALVLYWYQSKDRIIASEYWGKILLARDALVQNSTAAAIVRITVPDLPGTFEVASTFAAGIIPAVQRCFAK